METMSVRRTPQQERAENTVNSILIAAEKLLSEEQQDASFTTNHIAELAGVSIGSLYQYFPNKEAILARLVERMLNESRRVLYETLHHLPETVTVEEFVQQIVGSLSGVFTSQGHTRRVLLEQLPMLGKFKTLQDLKLEIQAVIKDELVRRFPDHNTQDMESCVFVIVQSVETVLNSCVYQEFDEQKTSKIVKELNTMIAKYLKSR